MHLFVVCDGLYETHEENRGLGNSQTRVLCAVVWILLTFLRNYCSPMHLTVGDNLLGLGVQGWQGNVHRRKRKRSPEVVTVSWFTSPQHVKGFFSNTNAIVGSSWLKIATSRKTVEGGIRLDLNFVLGPHKMAVKNLPDTWCVHTSVHPHLTADISQVGWKNLYSDEGIWTEEKFNLSLNPVEEDLRFNFCGIFWISILATNQRSLRYPKGYFNKCSTFGKYVSY